MKTVLFMMALIGGTVVFIPQKLDADLMLGCMVPWTRPCDAVPIQNPCAGNCNTLGFGVVCGWDALLGDDTYDWYKPAPPNQPGDDTVVDGEDMKCGTLFQCKCDIDNNLNPKCVRSFLGGVDWIQSQMYPEGDPCVGDPLTP
ncbi:MAG: hypothetical protein ABL921_03310 [Pirellula sp.]